MSDAQILYVAYCLSLLWLADLEMKVFQLKHEFQVVCCFNVSHWPFWTCLVFYLNKWHVYLCLLLCIGVRTHVFPKEFWLCLWKARMFQTGFRWRLLVDPVWRVPFPRSGLCRGKRFPSLHHSKVILLVYKWTMLIAADIDISFFRLLCDLVLSTTFNATAATLCVRTTHEHDIFGNAPQSWWMSAGTAMPSQLILATASSVEDCVLQYRLCPL